jgi:hypothetical protein
MQPVHVLSKEDLALAFGFEPDKSVMRVVGQGMSKASVVGGNDP